MKQWVVCAADTVNVHSFEAERSAVASAAHATNYVHDDRQVGYTGIKLDDHAFHGKHQCQSS